MADASSIAGVSGAVYIKYNSMSRVGLLALMASTISVNNCNSRKQMFTAYDNHTGGPENSSSMHEHSYCNVHHSGRSCVSCIGACCHLEYRRCMHNHYSGVPVDVGC